MIGDFKMNCLKYHENAKTKYFYDNIFEKGVIPIINRPTSKHVDFNGTVNEIYDTFLKSLTDIYDSNFPIREYILKDKDIKSPWISKGLKKILKDKAKFIHQIS